MTARIFSGMVSVRFFRQGQSVPPLEKIARQAVSAVFRHERHSPQPVQIIWASREKVRALNLRFRKVRRFTDVIAFRYEDQESVKSKGRSSLGRSGASAAGRQREPLGDIFIAVPQARRNARRFHVPFREELLRLVTHGTLHLFGYTDYSLRAKKRMWAVQEAVLGKILKRRSQV